MTLVGLFMLVLIMPVAVAQEEKVLDIQLWSRSTAKETVIIPWAVYYGPKSFVLDLRHNFDANNTAGIFIGRQFGGEKLYVIPEMGYLAGDFSGVSPEFYLGANKGRLMYFSQWQWAASLRSEDNSWAYQWNDVLVRVNKHLSIGADTQTFWEKNTDSPANTDIGPAFRIDIGRGWYGKFWWANRVAGADHGDWVMFCAVGKVARWK